MRQLVRRYRLLLVCLFFNFLLLLYNPLIGLDAIDLTVENLNQMLVVIPPIFILLGLMDIWVPKETMIKLMGKDSGILGISIAFLLGSLSAGPLYAAFPVAGVLMKKGSRLFNVLIFIGAWSTTKIPLLLFEVTTMGWRFMVARFILDIFGIVVIAYITESMITNGEISIIYKKIENL
jgi:uncharacterized membrane protein YraQ (UPF0718 family)